MALIQHVKNYSEHFVNSRRISPTHSERS